MCTPAPAAGRQVESSTVATMVSRSPVAAEEGRPAPGPGTSTDPVSTGPELGLGHCTAAEAVVGFLVGMAAGVPPPVQPTRPAAVPIVATISAHSRRIGQPGPDWKKLVT